MLPLLSRKLPMFTKLALSGRCRLDAILLLITLLLCCATEVDADAPALQQYIVTEVQSMFAETEFFKVKGGNEILQFKFHES